LIKIGDEKMGRLENKVAVVTGASSGMGEAIAKLFASEGASVVAMARRKERLDDLIKEIEAGGGKATAVAGDVTIEEDVQNSIKTAVDEYGKLDIVISNAGLLDQMTPVADVTDDLWDAVFDVNVKGPMRFFRAAIPLMEEAGGGTFVTVSSLGGIKCGIAGSTYIASKHAVLGLAKSVAYMYADKNIRSNVIAPGAVMTEMGQTSDTSERGMERAQLTMACMPRMGEASEIAQLALFLASDESSLVNGAVVTADAGWGAG
jgi:NAD(P)-dependent dehydrogenase (short-subunit alcohol dehydrogenase family)